MKSLRRVAVALVVSIVVLLGGGAALMTQPIGRRERVGPVVAVDARALERHVRDLAKPRDITHVEALEATATYITERLKELRFAPVEQPYVVDGRTYKNLSVIIGDPSLPRVVMGAHYDSCEALPAADDNASGVAVLLAVARQYGPMPPKVPVELVFWTLEEPPAFRTERMGSRVHAKTLKAAGVQVLAAISVETVGYFRDEPGSQHSDIPAATLLYGDRGDSLFVVSDLANLSLTRLVKGALRAGSDLPIHSVNAPAAIPGIDWSDHHAYWLQGYPAVMLTDTAPNRNPNYHRASDTPDTLDYARMAKVAASVCEVGYALGESH